MSWPGIPGGWMPAKMGSLTQRKERPAREPCYGSFSIRNCGDEDMSICQLGQIIIINRDLKLAVLAGIPLLASQPVLGESWHSYQPPSDCEQPSGEDTCHYFSQLKSGERLLWLTRTLGSFAWWTCSFGQWGIMVISDSEWLKVHWLRQNLSWWGKSDGEGHAHCMGSGCWYRATNMRSRRQTSIVINLVASTMTHNKLTFPDREKREEKAIITKEYFLVWGEERLKSSLSWENKINFKTFPLTLFWPDSRIVESKKCRYMKLKNWTEKTWHSG